MKKSSPSQTLKYPPDLKNHAIQLDKTIQE